MRCQVLAEVDTQCIPGCSLMRFTVSPLRASRALALRFYACHRAQWSSFTLAACGTPAGGGAQGAAASEPRRPTTPDTAWQPSASKAASGSLTGRNIDGSAVPRVFCFAASDAEDLVGGQQNVAVVPGASPACFSVDVGVYGERVGLVQSV